MLAKGTKVFVVPGEHGFSSFQVENVHWKCTCAAHQCIIEIKFQKVLQKKTNRNENTLQSDSSETT